MRRLSVLGSLAVPFLLAACSGGAPSAIPHQGASHAVAHVPSIVDPLGRLDIYALTRQRQVSYDLCPLNGATEYVSDAFNSVILIYRGKFAGQAPCGQIASSSLSSPRGLYVNTTTHNLYVANWGGSNILVFPKGQTTPSNIYSDPTLQNPNDVTVNADGVLIATNEESSDFKERGSISTWLRGPNGGSFVGNFPMTNAAFGLYLAPKTNGTIYFTDVDATSGLGALWKLSCPAGACGAQTKIVGVTIGNPGGMTFNSDGHLVVNDATSSTVDTFSLPHPRPSTFPLPCCPVGMAIDDLHKHWFDTQYTSANEYVYPSFALVGSVPSQGGAMFGIAVDP